MVSLVAQMVKNLPTVWEKGMATRSNILAWRVPWTEEPGGLQFMRLQSDVTEQLTHTLLSVLFSHQVVSDPL